MTVGTAPTIGLTIANDYGRKPAGNVALTVKQGGGDGRYGVGRGRRRRGRVHAPALAAGTYEYTLSYAGDDQLVAFTETGTLTVNPAPVVETPTARGAVNPVRRRADADPGRDEGQGKQGPGAVAKARPARRPASTR